MKDRKILITGGCGTIGTAILKRYHDVAKFVVLSRDPLKLQRTKLLFPNVEIFCGDVCNPGDVSAAIFGCDTVIHAAAQKHIPEGEANPMSVINVNVQGSMNIAVACHDHGVKDVVGISTDKAVHPINAYGASKMLMERLFQQFASHSETKFHLVRYGNVIGSNGSVVQVWKKMEAETGVVHATHPDMTRFWMTADYAVKTIVRSLEEQSGTILIPGDIRGLCMKHMAEWLLKPETRVIYDGIRPGEKMSEELISREESLRTESVSDSFYFRITNKIIKDTIFCMASNSWNKPMNFSEFERLFL